MTKLVDFLNRARAEHFALGAFNLDGFETLKAVAVSAKELNSAVIVEVSPGEEKSLGLRNVASIVDNARREFGVPIFLNLDHAEDMEVIEEAIDFGFDLVHYDGSKLPLQDNITNAKKVVAIAHGKNILVEGEMDHIPVTNNELPLTNPEEAKKFVAETGVDIFAVSIGNKHGVGQDEKLDLDLLQKIREALPETFFSLHGGSGIAAGDIQEAIKLGVVKINVNTEMRMAFKQNLSLSGDELAWYKITEPALAAVQKVVEEKIRIFGSEGKTEAKSRQ